jgi:hypothetical protein
VYVNRLSNRREFIELSLASVASGAWTVGCSSGLPRIMEQVSHRSCPLPEKRWVLSMRWHDLLFLHWPIRPALLRPLIPSPLELDTFEDWGMDWHCTVPYDRRQAALCSLILCVSRDQRSNLRKDARPKWRLGFQLGCDELGCSQNRATVWATVLRCRNGSRFGRRYGPLLERSSAHQRIRRVRGVV